jgi:hypothetical protein
MHVIPSYLCIGLGLIGIGLMSWAVSGRLIAGLIPVGAFIVNSLIFKINEAKTRNLIRWVEIAGLVYVLIGMLQVWLWTAN